MIETAGTVVFMGAGASKALGLPLTDEILPKIVRRLHGSLPDEPVLFPGRDGAELRDHLNRTFRAVYPGLDLTRVPEKELPNITSVLSFLDHLLLYDQPAALRFGKQPLLQGRRLLERAMMEVLSGIDLAPITEQLGDAQDYTAEMLEIPGLAQRPMNDEQRGLLERFVSWMFDRSAATGGRLNIVTTNYDVAVETPIFERVGAKDLPRTIDFGFDWRNPFTEALVPRPERPSVGLYKLHGSFNWLRCDLCGQIYLNTREAIAYLSFNERQAWANTCACGAWPLRHLIVAPSMVRDIRDPHLLNVWRSATEALRTAKEWYIIGYSLPHEDLAIRSMLLRGFCARGLEDSGGSLGTRPGRAGPRVTVVQKGDAAQSAYAAMFPNMEFLTGGLEQLVTRA